jgi:hypothetical protein
MLFPPAALERAMTIREVVLRAMSGAIRCKPPRSSGAPPAPCAAAASNTTAMKACSIHGPARHVRDRR